QRRMTPGPEATRHDHALSLYGGAIGLWVALALIKFGNPVILDREVPAPANSTELLIASWPARWGYALTITVGLAGGLWRRWPKDAPRWLLALPAGWLGWQFISAGQTVDRGLTSSVLFHFCACVAAFYIGALVFSATSRLRLFWVGLVGGLSVVLVVGW